MTVRDDHRARLRTLPAEEWEPYLLRECGLPGPRGNLELAAVVADEGDPARFRQWASITSDDAPTNEPGEFLAFCGVLGLGETIARGDTAHLGALRTHANDARWRIREAVAMGLQRIGDRDPELLRRELPAWAQGSWLERRAAAAGACEPRLLADPAQARWTLDLLDGITASLAGAPDRRDDGFRALRKGLGYCWSVAIVAAPESGRRRLERWAESGDPDIRWVVRENLRKKRLVRLDPEWTVGLAGRLSGMKYETREALIEDIRQSYSALVERLEAIPDEHYDEPGVWGDDWSITDLVVHLSEWHRMFLRWYEDGAAGRRPEMPAPGYKWNETPRLNREIQARHAGRPWDEVWNEFERTHGRVLALVESLDEPTLLESGHFDWTRKSSLSTYIGPNTASHYRFAVRMLKRWQKQRASG